MKPAREWANEFTNRFVINAKDGFSMEEYVKKIQDDVRRIPDGYILVPEIPTKEMMLSAMKCWHNGRSGITLELTDCYTAMIKSKPIIPSEEQK